MPNLEQHLATSAANEALAVRLADLAEYSWSVTCLFYSALHLTEAYLIKQGRFSANHHQRDLNIIREPSLSRIRQLVYAPMATALHSILGVN